MIRSLLIANRGEIACRIMRTAKRLGIRTIAVFSDADRDALHVRSADEAVRIGPAPARDSYLSADAVLVAARQTGADAIHPGYGFLSENALFAEACTNAGLIFVGPPASAIAAMGSKSAAKTLMAKAGVPLVPGYHGGDQTLATLTREAARIGYPVLIKASAGGGGKGMKAVSVPADFETELASARREAKSAFGDDSVLIERYLDRPRHIEIQVFADSHGHCLSLFERDCSIQRRHQKVIEEAPAPGMTETLRTRMSAAAIAAARSIGYVGAGTVEFLLDAGGGFYFMEMNTRLQVEHPVTEFITGLDLVEWQLRIASGEPLPKTQEEIAITGHAIEARIYAEDPDRDFLPQTGTIRHLTFPQANANVRIDTGFEAGGAIRRHYDPMIGKLIVWDKDRPAAIKQLEGALSQTHIAGLATNVPFLGRIARHPAFATGGADTGFIPRHEADLIVTAAVPPDAVLRAAAAALLPATAKPSAGPWDQTDGWRMNGTLRDHLTLTLTADPAKRFRQEVLYGVHGPIINGEAAAGLPCFEHNGDVTVFSGGETWRLTRPASDSVRAGSGSAMDRVLSPMPGQIIAIHVGAGTSVTKGSPLIVLGAMKMEHILRAPRDGTIEAVACQPGDQVTEGRELLRFTATP